MESTVIIESKEARMLRVGAVSCFLLALVVVAAMVLYFVWPYPLKTAGVEEILKALHERPFSALVSLDLSFFFAAPLQSLIFIALYLALRKRDEPLSLLALVAAISGAVLMIVCRPLLELQSLAGAYANASGEAERQSLIASGRSFLAMFEGSAWAVQTILFFACGAAFSFLMLKVPAFGKPPAILGLVASLVGLGFALPRIGLIFLFVNTILSVPWMILTRTSTRISFKFLCQHDKTIYCTRM